MTKQFKVTGMSCAACSARVEKTGTITSGEPKVTDLIPAEGYTDESLMDLV